ncbi:type II secretion system protein N [Enterobacter sp. ECC-219]|uniref:type II secretion system protein N n=1 Tax=Enterobacter sp. ECC-219 TaxID=3116480 RepID=UPI003754F1CC
MTDSKVNILPPHRRNYIIQHTNSEAELRHSKFNKVIMITKNIFLKHEQLLQHTFVLLIFISIMITFGSIYISYSKWHNNRQLAQESQITLPSLRTPSTQVWRLSAQPAVDFQPAATKSHLDVFLSGVILSGIIFSSHNDASRAILKEGSQQNIYAINQSLRSEPSVHIVAITKNQVIFSRAGKIKQLSLLKSASHENLARASTPALTDNPHSNTQFQDVKEN